ncbi:tRNA lysidine(34) synthetase TilS [Candidatus Oleimmundimicrobium sp.]|uniref:tRNA lysidine(34) synthetase TilS n=1 Tax=Candidatus Oleimmundimicrobium sp. TaxID=3060597 RepID=UPI002721ED39|nr:tRNA lysidine(34) synthetase TilS [Candidatus Oleimmundimicrobium sp.]MDO8885913.1 tRNA lysidine(34) synthetase TilS [Candidatus Oleimmundimicrobium sp.]
MLEFGDKVLVAVSGGQDSVASIYLLLQIRNFFNLDLHVFHLDHMLRGDISKEDAQFVKALAEKEGLPSTILSFDVPLYAAEKNLSVEEGAREARYMLFKKVANEIGANKVALGHTVDDQVETFLMCLLRGSGLKGLRAIPPVRDIFIRPLIEISRRETEEYCRAQGIEFKVDASNFEFTYLRNKIRHNLIPYLEEYNPNLKETILRTIEVVGDDERFLDEIASKEFNRVSVIKEGLIKFSLDDLKALSVAIRRRVLRMGIEILKGDLKGVEFKHIKDLLLDAEKMSKLRRDIPGQIAIIKEYNNIILIRRDLLEKRGHFEVILSGPGKIEIPELNIEFEVCITEVKGDLSSEKGILKDKFCLTKGEANLVANLDADKVHFPIQVRNHLPGDKFFPLGLKGEKKLQDYFVDVKLPERLRDKVPIILSEGEIIWVVGHRIDDRFKVTKETQRILNIKSQFKDNNNF